MNWSWNEYRSFSLAPPASFNDEGDDGPGVEVEAAVEGDA